MLVPPAKFLLLPALLWQAVGEQEYHAEHLASHATALWRSPKARSKETVSVKKHSARNKFTDDRVQVTIGPKSEGRVTATTKLEDMTSEYTGFIGVGTDSQGGPEFQARVVFDTGSTNLWVASVLCTGYPCSSRDREFYDPKKSLTQESYTGEDGNSDIDIMFGTGELRGPLHIDSFHVGPMKVKRQPFAMIREMTGDVFSSFPFEGILGLGFRSLSWGHMEPFFEHVIDQQLLKHNEFAFYLNADSSQPSALLWGGIDKGLYDGPIRMFPVVQAHYWALELVDFRLGKESLLENNPEDPLRRLIVDSGTTYFTAPSWLKNKLMPKIPDAKCADVETYEPLVYVLRSASNETFELQVSQETYMIGDESGEDCRPAFMELDISNKYGPAMILGEVFMRHFFTVFSRGSGENKEAKIGFAQAKIGALPKVDEPRPAFLQIQENTNATTRLIRREAQSRRARPESRVRIQLGSLGIDG